MATGDMQNKVHHGKFHVAYIYIKTRRSLKTTASESLQIPCD